MMMERYSIKWETPHAKILIVKKRLKEVGIIMALSVE
jgi:hypothetical protein